MVEEDRGKQELRVYPQPVHMLAQVQGGPEVVELKEYLEGKVGQRVHYANVLRPETLPKRLQNRRLQAVTGQVPVRERIMRWYRHKGMDLREEYLRCVAGIPGTYGAGGHGTQAVAAYAGASPGTHGVQTDSVGGAGGRHA